MQRSSRRLATCALLLAMIAAPTAVMAQETPPPETLAQTQATLRIVRGEVSRLRGLARSARAEAAALRKEVEALDTRLRSREEELARLRGEAAGFRTTTAVL